MTNIIEAKVDKKIEETVDEKVEENANIEYILNRINYYTSNINKKWIINFEQNSGKCIYDNNLVYTCPLEHQHGTYYIDKSFSVEKFRKINQKKKDLESHHPAKIDVENYNINAYIVPCINFHKKYNSDFLHRLGDVFFSTDLPIATKTRPICSFDKSHNFLLRLDFNRHFTKPIEQIKKCDIPFKEKNNKVVWRGDINGELVKKLHGRPLRQTLVSKYENSNNKMFDIGWAHTGIMPSKLSNAFLYVSDKEGKDTPGKGPLSIEEQLKSKFLISVEGGDVATGLKWMLYSNSVVLMTKPTMESWFMEGTLTEWEHYVPLDNNFSDLDEKYDWCLNNLDKCEEISRNATKFIKQFLNEEIEEQIEKLVFEKYKEYVHINLIEEKV